MGDLLIFWLGGFTGAMAALVWSDRRSRMNAVITFVFVFPLAILLSTVNAVRRAVEFDRNRSRIALGVLTPFGRFGVYRALDDVSPFFNPSARVLRQIGRTYLLWRPRD